MLVQFIDLSRFRHRMPLVADPAGGENEGIILIRSFTTDIIRDCMKESALRRRQELPVGKQPDRSSVGLPGRIWPLYRPPLPQNIIVKTTTIDRCSGSQ